MAIDDVAVTLAAGEWQTVKEALRALADAQEGDSNDAKLSEEVRTASADAANETRRIVFAIEEEGG